MPRKRRPKSAAGAAAGRRFEPSGNLPSWRWATLPVWLALTGGFILGYYALLIDSGVAPGTGATILFYAALIGFSLGLSRITSVLIVRWRTRRARAAAEAQAHPSDRPAHRRGGRS